MALSEEDKKRIEEDEYRKTISDSPKPQSSSEILGIIALLLPICGAGFAWIKLSGTTVLGSFFSNTIEVTLAVVILGTAILIAIEASSVGAGSATDLKKGTTKRREGPVVWFFFVVLLWIVGYPLWMYRRSQYGLKNYLGVAIAIALVYAVSMALLGAAVQDAQQSFRQQFSY